IIVCVLKISGSFAQLTTSNALTPTQLVNNILLGGGITATNITYTGYANAIGSFSVTGTNNLGMNSGVVMTTGTILANDPTYGTGQGPQGPNNTSGAGADNGQPGDPYLTGIAGINTYNAAILEFDFVPQSDTIKFNYVFGTEEYMEWITGGFADVFAFVVSGVTVNHPATNVALLPGTTTPVTALNVNLNTNPNLYVDNGDGFGTGTAPDGPTVQYDGFTVVLTAKDTVTCGQTYHIKMMIADAIDGAVDAGVFLQQGSFSAAAPVNISSDVQFSTNDTLLYEGCASAFLYFVRPPGFTANADTFIYSVSGTAGNGTDITFLNDTVIFNSGQDTSSIVLTALNDGLTESLESITITIPVTNACGFVSNLVYTMYIGDATPLDVNLSDTTLCLGQSLTLNAIPGGGAGGYNFAWNNGLLPDSSQVVSPNTSTDYIVTLTDNCGTPAVSDTASVTVLNSLPDLVPNDDVNACEGDVISFPTIINGGYSPFNIVWTEPVPVQDSVTIQNPTLSQILGTTSGGVFIITVTDNCLKTDADTIVVEVKDCNVNIPNVVTPNNDGLNDALYFKNLEQFPGSSLLVFNRWGSLVFESSNYNNAWVPDVSDGVYYFILELPEGKNFTGYFHVFRNK
ncbi:MAG: choice-of-anchor L domain-containing protein, partial [Bacteroidota bacterium]